MYAYKFSLLRFGVLQSLSARGTHNHFFINCVSAFRAFFPCLFRSLSHNPYYTIKSLFWTLPSAGECPKGELKEVKEGKGNSGPRMAGTITVLVASKTIISMNKDREDRLEILQFLGKHLLRRASVGI